MGKKKLYYDDEEQPHVEAVQVQEKKLLWTDNIALASTLQMYYPMQEIDKGDSRKMMFGFIDTEDIRMVEDRFWKKELVVEPQAFYFQLMALRLRINQEKNN